MERANKKAASPTKMGKAAKPGSPKRVKGQCPLRGQGAELPCGVWGNAPTVPRATSMPNALNKGAGSEASLPLTLRVLRRAPKLLYQPTMLCRAKWARPDCRSFKHSCFLAGDFPSKRESADFPRLVRLELLRRVKRVVYQRHQSQRNRNPEDDSVQRQRRRDKFLVPEGENQRRDK